jgi:DNA invertase Pin-like site-specific DNA recombinase
MSDRAKITEAHRRRRAVVYVRQSTLGQVERNTESAARQYALRNRAVELGWPQESVVVVDGDTGRSGASAAGRVGFKELVAEVGLGHVGVVLALEVSRLARSSADWHQLLDLCALTATLIADADGVYSPVDFNDRLLLGLKGTMSEAELHLIRARLDGGLRSKAQRGELRLALPVGLDRDEDGRVVLCPDEQVRHAIERVFVLWRRLGSARQVVSELVAEGQKLPRRTVGQRRGAVGARQLWRRARPADQPGICGRVRVRPHPHAQARRRARRGQGQDGRAAVGAVVRLPARPPSRLCLLARLPRRARAAALEREAAR